MWRAGFPGTISSSAKKRRCATLAGNPKDSDSAPPDAAGTLSSWDKATTGTAAAANERGVEETSAARELELAAPEADDSFCFKSDVPSEIGNEESGRFGSCTTVSSNPLKSPSRRVIVAASYRSVLYSQARRHPSFRRTRKTCRSNNPLWHW